MARKTQSASVASLQEQLDAALAENEDLRESLESTEQALAQANGQLSAINDMSDYEFSPDPDSETEVEEDEEIEDDDSDSDSDEDGEEES